MSWGSYLQGYVGVPQGLTVEPEKGCFEDYEFLCESVPFRGTFVQSSGGSSVGEKTLRTGGLPLRKTLGFLGNF